jgi:hypothetical protein
MSCSHLAIRRVAGFGSLQSMRLPGQRWCREPCGKVYLVNRVVVVDAAANVLGLGWLQAAARTQATAITSAPTRWESPHIAGTCEAAGNTHPLVCLSLTT